MPLRDLNGLDKAMQTIRGLKLAVAKNVVLQEHLEREKKNLQEMENGNNYSEEQKQEVGKKNELVDQLEGSQKEIDTLKDRFSNQIKIRFHVFR